MLAVLGFNRAASKTNTEEYNPWSQKAQGWFITQNLFAQTARKCICSGLRNIYTHNECVYKYDSHANAQMAKKKKSAFLLTDVSRDKQ